VRVDRIGSIGNQAAGADEEAEGVDCGQWELGRKPDDQITMNVRQTAQCHDQPAIGVTREGRDGALDFAGITDVDRVATRCARAAAGM
jgi:hypothetical protein